MLLQVRISRHVCWGPPRFIVPAAAFPIAVCAIRLGAVCASSIQFWRIHQFSDLWLPPDVTISHIIDSSAHPPRPGLSHRGRCRIFRLSLSLRL
jgi:hypothetical protein